MVFLLSIILLLSTLGIIVGAVAIVYYDVNNKKIKLEQSKKNIRTEEELMSIVYNILERKWAYRVEFHFKLKDIRIPKFEFEWDYLLNETMNALSPDVREQLKYYYKDEETVIKTISELIQIYLLTYMENNNIKR